MISKNRHRKVGGRLDVTFADEVCEAAETQTTCMTDELDRALKHDKALNYYIQKLS